MFLFNFPANENELKRIENFNLF